MDPCLGPSNPAILCLRGKCWQVLGVRGGSSRTAWFYPLESPLLTASPARTNLAHSSASETGYLLSSEVIQSQNDHLLTNLPFSQEVSYLESCDILPIFSFFNGLFLEPCLNIISSCDIFQIPNCPDYPPCFTSNQLKSFMIFHSELDAVFQA